MYADEVFGVKDTVLVLVMIRSAERPTSSVLRSTIPVQQYL